MRKPQWAVLGAGAWGTALASVIAQTNQAVYLWGRDPAVINHISTYHRHPWAFPDIELPQGIVPTTNLQEALEVSLALVVIPTQALASFFKELQGFASLPALLLCAKGIEIGTHRFPLDIAHDLLPQAKVAVLSGPNFAIEVAQGKPSATTIATDDLSFPWLDGLASTIFRPYLSDDPVGVQLCGALKNVLAIACGVIAGKGLGENARAAALSRGSMEIARLGLKMGAKIETLLGLAGLGDIALTCTSSTSRNFSLGYALAQGKSLEEATDSGKKTCEGMHTARSVEALSRQYDVDMPLFLAVHTLLYENISVDDLISGLMKRSIKQETVEAHPVEESIEPKEV
jgi:glycerol-3-phosphate dehydrogenase (NAD(P)+)